MITNTRRTSRPVSEIQVAETGPTFSRIVFGLWRLAEWRMSRQQLVTMIEACLDRGITTMDHADIYGEYACERLFGDALEGHSALRDRIQLITKCGIKIVSERRPEHRIQHYDTSRTHIIASAEASLKLLRTDRIDLLLIHRPDPLMDADEVAKAFTSLKETGKVLHFGVSNFTTHQFDLLQSRLDFPLVTNQVEFSVMNMTGLFDGTLDQCQRLRIAPMAWSPMGGGDLFTSKTDQAVRLRKALAAVGDELGGVSIDQVALAWILTHPARAIPIIGTGKVERAMKAADAESFRLDRQQWFSIWTASTGTPVP